MVKVMVNQDDESFHSEDIQNATGAKENKDADQERATLAKKESRYVTFMKIAVFVVLVIAFGIVSDGVYSILSEDQKQNFEDAFTSDAIKVLETFGKSGERYLEALDALSVSITSHAKSSGQKFPNVTLPDFGIRFANSRVLSGSFMIGYHPLITEETRAGWEAYSVANRYQYIEALEVELSLRKRQNAEFDHDENSTMLEIPANFTDDIWWFDKVTRLDNNSEFYVAEKNSGPYLPMWQMSPVPLDTSVINFDTLSHAAFAQSQLETLRTGLAVVDEAVNVETKELDGTSQFFSSLLATSQYRADIDDYQGDPQSAMAYPVFDSFDLDKRKVVGVLETSVYWRLFLKDILPDGTRGITCVIENSRNQKFTYEINDDVTFVGNGDLHETKFSYMEKNFSHVKQSDKYSSSGLETKSFTSVGWNDEYCAYTMRIFPSQATQNLHINDEPLEAAVVVDSVFLFTSMIFIFYTIAVGRRQRVVMDRAVASGAIVSSLFPSQVRDQLYQENEADTRRASFLTRDGEVQETKGRPIASVFEKTTIMFADMVGFTAWSAKRTPVEVFELLEALYQAFDTIALRRKVFKVETIGDCYVAVAGLPDPQEDHAIIMAKFADDCMTKMAQLTTELAGVLGEDTATLAMRVGLHSGSVTGGVLRGQKSRFQLFGDTMNTASRMESNGKPHRIHVSQETANELIANGKSSWVTPREDKIVAKGKGELQTYWVTIRVGSASMTGSTANSDFSKVGAGHVRDENVKGDMFEL